MATSRMLLLFLLLSSYAGAQTNRYLVFFKDKNGTPHTVDQPSTYLSSRAIQRRTRMNIGVNQDDLPVTPSYVTQVRAAGAKAFFTTRWMNGVLVEASSAQITTISSLPFVASTEFVAPNHQLLGGRSGSSRSAGGSTTATDDQLHMLALDSMHADGFRGEGVLIAVLDSGFPGVDVHSPFQDLRNEGRILLTTDFITNSNNVYQFDDHGTQVLSVMAAESPSFHGGAPGAGYMLFVTEDVPTEFRIEEYNWLFAAERADSAGADIIQSSLGYNTFDDPSMDYTTAQLNGATAVVSRAAGWSRDRGIFVVVSAGNTGEEPWQLITPPADAFGILSVGAVTITEVKATFSAIGPSTDGRTKPDVVALGTGVKVVGEDGQLTTSSGTSMSAPLVSSLVAGLIQKYPALYLAELINAITHSATLGTNPDNQKGYGVPSYVAVKNFLELNGSFALAIYPNPVQKTLWLYPGRVGEEMEVMINDSQGKEVMRGPLLITWANNPLAIDVSGLVSGVYVLRIQAANHMYTVRFVKL